MFVLCPKYKETTGTPVKFINVVEGLDIPTYMIGTEEYEVLKASVRADGEYSDDERKHISEWRTARLRPIHMTRSQLELIKRYVKGSPRW